MNITRDRVLRLMAKVSAGLLLAAGMSFATGTPEMESFDPSTYKGKTGKIVLPYSGDSTLYVIKVGGEKAESGLYLSGNGKSVVAPVGMYRVDYYAMSMKDKKGATWSFSSQPKPEKNAQMLIVRAGKNSKMKPAEGMVASIKVDQTDEKNVAMSFQIKASNGESCSIEQIGKNAKPPRFKVLSKTGKVLMTGAFEYG